MYPFFDDEPDSAFGRPFPMHSQESSLPLARSGAPPAGSGPPKTSLDEPQG
ncbi:aminophospholipid translocase [Stygiomarasmius scandens]|uniref:Aminophospholipid translocase n=1 Tax=Marasmiellus scandens TaxID=2682957 RepID=A0ABR1JEM4_9AGAR